jgi:uncharacterized protein YecE (DUF72 family)
MIFKSYDYEEVKDMIYIGTSGYSYKDWIGPFYPEGIKDSYMLEYYSQHFNFTEVNSTYYHMPRLQLFESLNKKTPDGFKFAVKLFGGFTHERSAGALEAQQFNYALLPLIESGKLTCLLAQFPYSFHYNEKNMEHLKRLKEWFENIEVVIEFRNREWIRSETMQFLKKEGLGYVCVDEPDIKGLIKNVTAVTSRISYLRMHGRNAQKWYGSEGSDRYNYLYSKDELMEWVPRIKEMEKMSSITLVAFNNHPIGKAIINARELTDMLLI